MTTTSMMSRGEQEDTTPAVPTLTQAPGTATAPGSVPNVVSSSSSSSTTDPAQAAGPTAIDPTHSTATSGAGITSSGGDSKNKQQQQQQKYPRGQNPRLRYEPSYWWPYRTYVKQRWIGRELLEVISTEFRDRSIDYYRHALESGVTTVNGVRAGPGFVLRNGDRIDNTVHRHEPPVANDPIKVIHLDKDRNFVVISKPGSVPVHPTGRYFRHTVLELLKSQEGITGYSVNRLDRLTSGLMILALTSAASRDLALEFSGGAVRKEYIARTRGRFPDGLIEVDLPLLTVDRQMGLVIVTPEGKEAKTLFRKLSYDPERDESVVHCRPMTGRTHQIRVHLQYLGHPISNDPLYGHEQVWGRNGGKGGIDLEPYDPDARAKGLAKRMVEQPATGNGEGSSGRYVTVEPLVPAAGDKPKTEEHRDYVNIDITSPIPLSKQARDIIVKLRRQRDEAEDWAKWHEVVFRAKEAQDGFETNGSAMSTPQVSGESDTSARPKRTKETHPRLTTQKVREHPAPLPADHKSPLARPAYVPPGFCQECYVPLPDDPDPEGLFIYLHALRYTTPNLGRWETPLPNWAGKKWAGDWRGYSDEAAPGPFEEERGETIIRMEEGAKSVGEVTKEGAREQE